MNEKTKRIIESVTPKGDLSWYVKWISSIFIMLAMVLTASHILYPLNLFFHLVGVSGWCFVGYLWHDRSLLLLNGIAIAIFIMGILQYFFGGAY
jgi:hypothetical protein|tara:strand:+ start:1826 stop:2107 length:282 start_codon:yes stop_codon:yes gene_type:complete